MRVGSGDNYLPDYNPAGLDAALRTALEDLRAGRWMAMRSLLAGTGTDWALRTGRTQVLGMVAASSNVVQVWRAEEPHSADALAMWARVAVMRAVQAHRRSHPSAGRLEQEARGACLAAAQAWPEDPVPWVCLLALAQVDVPPQRREHWCRPPEVMLAPGPWALLDEVRDRDRFNREAFHRMFQWFVRPGGQTRACGMDFARWVASWAPAGSPLKLLPLYGFVEHFRYQRHEAESPSDPLVGRRWIKDASASSIETALAWFDHSPPANRLAVDLHYLAHALWASTRFQDAARVFTEIGPHATWLPWSHLSADPDRSELAEAELRRARIQSLRIAGGRQVTRIR
jgi:hypothetical protein